MQFQYPLRNLVGAVIACAVVCAIATRPPIRLGSVSITIVVGVLFAAVLEAVFRRVTFDISGLVSRYSAGVTLYSSLSIRSERQLVISC